MFEDNAQEDSDLFDTEPTEDVTNDASTNDELDLEVEENKEKPKSQDAETVREKTIESFQRKLDSGQITIDQIPSSQKWVVKHLKTAPKPEIDIDQIVDQKLAKRENDKEFASLKDKLNSATLKKDQKLTLQAEYKELVAHGVPSAKALKKAMVIAQVSLEDYSSKKAVMRVPNPGNARVQEENNDDPYEFEGDDYKGPKGTPEQRVAYLEKNRNSATGQEKSWQKYAKK